MCKGGSSWICKLNDDTWFSLIVNFLDFFDVDPGKLAEFRVEIDGDILNFIFGVDFLFDVLDHQFVDSLPFWREVISINFFGFDLVNFKKVRLDDG